MVTSYVRREDIYTHMIMRNRDVAAVKKIILFIRFIY